MQRYKVVIQYDGTDFFGWQIQQDKPTVQGTITQAMKTVLRSEVSVVGSGRTDTGVHAFGQVAHFDAPASVDVNKFLYSVNSLLPDSISITNMYEVDDEFHARFDAKKRGYLYFISTNKNPFFHRYSSFQYNGLEIEYLNRLSKVLLEYRDFASFTKNAKEQDSTECILYQAHWRKAKDLVVFSIEGNRFLHGMVRAIVGTLIQAMRDEIPLEEFKEIIEQKDRSAAGMSASAKGLFLNRVKY